MSDLGPAVALMLEELTSLPESERRIVGNIVRRKLADLCGEPVHDPPPVAEVQPMRDAEAKTFADEIVPYGKYKGESWGDVPRAWLEWLAEQKRSEAKKFAAFLKSKYAPQFEDDE